VTGVFLKKEISTISPKGTFPLIDMKARGYGQLEMDVVSF
jgi:hypothetical protein